MFGFEYNKVIKVLNCVNCARVVEPTSFHATAFCHIFHKEFVTILPPKNGERVVSLLEHAGLMNRSVINSVDIESMSKPID